MTPPQTFNGVLINKGPSAVERQFVEANLGISVGVRFANEQFLIFVADKSTTRGAASNVAGKIQKEMESVSA